MKNILHFKKILNKIPFKRLSFVFLAITVAVTNTVPVQAVSDFYSESDIQFYDPNACDPSGQTGSSETTDSETPEPGVEATEVAPDGGASEGSDGSDESGVSSDTLEGHKLPATKGGTGYEDPVNESGHLTTTGESVTFGKFASKGQDYRDYYVTMRWPYVKWAWNGTSSSVDNKEFNWYNKKPRKVVVTNPRTDKSIIAVVLEAGPAPYTGTKGSQSANGYSSPQKYTPRDYTGRVSGLPPKAISAIGAKQTESGRGDKLYYAWAPDQDADPGPTNLKATGKGGATEDSESDEEAVACCASSIESDESGALAGGDNTKKALNFFVSKGFTKEQAGGMVGNFIQESEVNPKKVEMGPYSGGKSESDTVPPPIGPQGQPGYGIAQWTNPGRKTKLKNYAKDKSQKVSSLALQLNFVMEEMTPGLESDLKKIKSGSERNQVEDAALLFHRVYEGSADGPAQIQERVDSGVLAIKNFTPSTTSGGSGESEETAEQGVCSCTESQGAAVADNNTAIQGVIRDLAGKNGNSTKIAVGLVDSNKVNDVGGETQMPARSTYKVYTAYATLKAIEDGKISWSTNTGYGTVEKTMRDMIVDSNNDAAAALRIGSLQSKIGTPARVTSLLQDEVGLSSKTVMGSGSASSAAGSNSKSTANDFVKFLKLLAKKKLPGVSTDSNYEKLIGYMKKAKSINPGGAGDRFGIVAGVDGTEVANKPGWGSDATNDVGIVYLKDKTYVVAILTSKSNANNEDSWKGVKKISKGIFNSISGQASNSCDSAAAGDLPGTVKNYAWPSYHAPQYVKRKPAYASAVSKATDEGKFIGGSVAGVAGIDCGGFVTRVLQDSGFDPQYNNTSAGKGNTTGGQIPYLKNSGKWKKINPNSASDLQPGDVAINATHTYLYVGDIDGFNSKIASASYSQRGNGRAPMAGQESPADSGYEWYRKK